MPFSHRPYPPVVHCRRCVIKVPLIKVPLIKVPLIKVPLINFEVKSIGWGWVRNMVIGAIISIGDAFYCSRIAIG